MTAEKPIKERFCGRMDIHEPHEQDMPDHVLHCSGVAIVGEPTADRSPIETCKGCGALVGNKALHEQWHMEIMRIRDAANNPDPRLWSGV